MNHNRKDRMKGNFGFGKRLLSTALAAAMAATAMGTQAFAQPEATDESAKIQPSRVVSWSWPEEAGLDWSEEDQVWLLSCVYSEDQPLTEETLTQLLPGQITAVVQAPSVSQPESTPVAPAQEEPAVVDTDTVEDLTVVEENVSTFETAATLDTAASDEGEEDPGSVESTDEVTSEEMGEATLGTVDAALQTLSLNLTWDFSGIQFPVQPGDYTFSASLPQGYQLDQNAPALKVKLSVSAAAVTMANGIETRTVPSGILENHIVKNVVSPSNVTIDLFDYAVLKHENGKEAETNHPVDNGGDINTDHELLFSVDGWGKNTAGKHYDDYGHYICTQTTPSINAWTGKSAGPYFDIVQPLLVDGYPVLTSGKTYNLNDDKTTESSLAYLFDKSSVPGKQGYYNVGGLLQMDSNGLMSYDSQKNFAEFDAANNKFILYDTPAVNSDSNAVADVHNGQFFPFNQANQVFDYNQGLYSNISSNDTETLNHYFGMHMKAYFMQPTGGKTPDDKDMTFNFSGDDDVWVFIDGVLIGDVGGIHDRVNLKINFATGDVTVSSGAFYDGSTQYQTTTIKKMVDAAGATNQVALNGNTLADGTYHTLDFFYLERGGNNSNLRLTTNLVEIPVSSVIKVDQLGNEIPGVTFSLYESNEKYEVTEGTQPIATGTTDEKGKLVLLDKDNKPINFADLAQQNRKNFVLKEEAPPAGYRSTGKIHLYYEEIGERKQGVLLSDNHWDSGSWAATTMQVSTAVTVHEAPTATSQSGTQHTLDPQTDKIFAVMMKRTVTGKAPTADDEWYAISGNVLDGWKLSDQPITDPKAFTADQKHYFTWNASTRRYELQFDSLPGDITKYYYMLDADKKGDTVYTIGYYYQKSDGTITRLDSDKDFSRQYAINAYVTNIKNYLFVQKVDDDGNPLADAEFTLYRADENGTFIQNYEYEVGTATTSDGPSTGEQSTGLRLDGIATFPAADQVLAEGTYYLVETKAPDGYVKNDTPVKVIVDKTGVYADAGDPADKVSTLVGVGSLVDSMAQFGSGSQEGLDRTLADIKAYKKTSSDGEEWTTHNDSDEDAIYLSRDLTQSAALEYGPTTSGKPYYFSIDTGWLGIGSIKQNYSEEGVHTTNKTQLDANQDVLNLFSHTTIVRVGNDPYKLTIDKGIASESGTLNDNNVANTPYSFTVTKVNGNATDTNYNGQVKVTVNGIESKPSFANGVLTVTRQGVGKIEIEALAAGTYQVGENISGLTNQKIDGASGVVNRWQSVTYQVDSGTATNEASVELELSEQNSADRTVTVTNNYQAFQKLRVTKQVTGNLGDKTKDFSFTMQITKNDGSYYGSDLLYGTGSKGDATIELNSKMSVQSGNQNVYTFQLKDNQAIEFEIPYGYTVEVTEDRLTGYVVKSRQYEAGSASIPGLGENNLQTIANLQAPYVIDYVNDCTIQPPTGLHGETRPYKAMVGLAGAAAVIGIAGWVQMRRRKRREQE